MIKFTHNGGPILIDVHPDDRMTYAQWHIKDYLGGIRELKPDQVGIYSIILSLLYGEMGRLRDDDKFIAAHCNCEIRYYRRIKEVLLATNKIFEADGYLYNNRAMAEIAKFCEMQKRKREAAVLREQRKRVVGADRPAELVDECASRASQAPDRSASGAPYARPVLVSSAAPAPVGYLSGNDKTEKLNEINGHITTAVVLLCQNETTADAEPRIYKEKELELDKEEEEIESTPLVEVAADGVDLNAITKTPARVKGTRLPEAWKLPRSWGVWAIETYVATETQIRREADMFRDYWIAKTGRGSTKADWYATWRNWIRGKNWSERAPSSFVQPQGSDLLLVPAVESPWAAVWDNRSEASDD